MSCEKSETRNWMCSKNASCGWPGEPVARPRLDSKSTDSWNRPSPSNVVYFRGNLQVVLFAVNNSEEFIGLAIPSVVNVSGYTDKKQVPVDKTAAFLIHH